jgi:hypothetical protein
MSLADKLELMESLWNDLSQRPDSFPSPAWHRDVLDERKQLVDEGKLQFLDWDSAIDDLRKELRENTPS